MAPKRNPTYSPAKLLYQLIQCLHHISLLTDADGKAVKAFSKKAEELDRFIRPAVLNSGIKEKISEVNKAWVTSVTQALLTHYQTQVDFLTGCVKPFNLSAFDLCRNIDTAKNWARRNFGNKLKLQTLSEFDRIVRATFEPPIKKSAKVTNQAPLQSASGAQRGGGSPVGGAQGVSGQVSTPRKRRLSVTPESCPPRKDTPKRARGDSQAPPKTYAQVAKSPPSRPGTSKRSLFNKVRRFPNLNGAKGQRIHSIWEIPKVAKDVLVIGTSNLSKISSVGQNDAQVLSYPGLKLYQLLSLLQAFKYGVGSADPGLKPSKVVLSVGLNDRGLNSNTNEMALKKVINEALRVFRDSQIYLAQISFGQHLKDEEKRTLRSLNKAIIDISGKFHNVHVIPALPARKFQLGSDGIHWTENCANATIEHYFQHLN